ncbi:MAG TPA: hypothetical protein VIG47_07850, partial [Gemmatimonadaceae bacterium]
MAKSSYGPLNPPFRDGSKRRAWNRWDTPGRTVYASDSVQTAYIEGLAWANEEATAHDRAIRKTAEFFDVSVRAARAMVEADWLKAGNMQPGWLPTVWRDGRRMYAITFPDGWWVDAESSDTLSAVSASLEDILLKWGITGTLTMSELTSNDRKLTTRIATWLREEVTLDDGTQPLGIQFPSKYGRSGEAAGTSWAYWMRAIDAGLSNEPVVVDEGLPIELNDAAFKRTAVPPHPLPLTPGAATARGPAPLQTRNPRSATTSRTTGELFGAVDGASETSDPECASVPVLVICDDYRGKHKAQWATLPRADEETNGRRDLVSRDREDAQQLQVEPDDGDHDAEGAGPAVGTGR